MTNTRSSYEIGHDTEERVSNALGGRLVPGSGNVKFLELDVTDKGRFVFSVKASETLRGPELKGIARLWREAVNGARGFTSQGDAYKPALALDILEDVVVIIRLGDYADIVTGEAEAFIESDKAQNRRDHSRRSLRS